MVTKFLRQDIFIVIALFCLLFVGLTTLARAVDPGGTLTNPTTVGDSVSDIFFSDLGRTLAPQGQPNPIAAWLFTFSLASIGVVLIVFFILFPRFFTRTWADASLAWLGSLAGIAAGVCFIGIALTSANLDTDQTSPLIYWAFVILAAATALYLPVLSRDRRYPKRYALVLGVFAAILAVYLYLLFFGPHTKIFAGVTIQATSQKIIAYASVTSIFIQSLGAYFEARRRYRWNKR